MEHPLVQIDPNATLEELQTRINELTSKLSVAIKSGNGHLSSQVRMALESYKIRYNHVVEQSYKSQTSIEDYTKNIKIS